MSKFPFKVFGFQIDVGRQIEQPEVIRAAVSGMSRYGYNTCMIYLEDAYQFERHPAIARNHAYTKEFMREIQSICARQKIELIPIIPSLGHCAYITRKKGYEKFDEGYGTEQNWGSLSPSFPETYDLLLDMYKDWCDHVPGKYLHVGLDESAAMGSYHIRTSGRDSFDAVKMFAAHCNRLNAMCKSLGRRMVIWGDMLYYLPAAIGLIDKDVIINDWYYYAFDKMPRVEAFNFSQIDLSGDLKKAGFEVWGCTAIWPNIPFAPIVDRWKSLNDWIRYGRQKGIDGILVTEWENSPGFYSNSDLLFRAFGTNLLKNAPDLIEKQVRETLKDITGVDCRDVVDDIMSLGDFHVTGHENRRMVLRPLASRANRNRLKECMRNYQKLTPMFSAMPHLIETAKNENGKQTLEHIFIGWEYLRLLWTVGMVVPDYYQALCDAAASGKDCSRLKEAFNSLAREIEVFAARYVNCWNRVRYPDDKQVVTKWATDAIDTLKNWAAALENGSPAEHPLISTPRLEYTLHCHHPALPVVLATAVWPDGHQQSAGETMICFESKYSTPDVKWRQFPSLPLERRELPSQLKFDSLNYGQVGVEDVYVIWKGTRYVYKAVKTEGKNIKQDGPILWLGPLCATLESPLLPEHHDIAWFERV